MAKFLDATGVTHLVSELDKRYKSIDYVAPEVTLATLGVTATAAELNKLDGATVTVEEINHLDGVTAPIQAQINTLTSSKQDKLTAGTGISITGTTIACTLDTTIYKVVEELPESPAAGDANKIHLVPDDNGQGQNVYLEYIWQGTKWELLGQSSASTEIAIDNITGLGSNWLAALKAAKPNWSLVGHEHTVAEISNLGTGWADALTTTMPSWALVGHTHTLANITDLHANWDAVLKAAPAFASATHTHTGAQVTLTGYAVGSAEAIAATDTVNAAFGKVQAYINSINTSLGNKLEADDIPDITVSYGGASTGYISAITVGGDGHSLTATRTELPDAPTLDTLGGVGTVNASGSGKLTLSAQKTGTTVSITGSIADYAIADIDGLQDALDSKLEAGDIVNITLENGAAVSGQYVSGATVLGNEITFTRADLPTAETLGALTGLTAGTGISISGSGTTRTIACTLVVEAMNETDIDAAIEAVGA